MTTEAERGRRGRMTPLGRKLLALLMGLGLSALLVEGLVLAVLGEQPKFPRHVVEAPWGLRYNEPGAVYRHKSADVTIWFRINEQGMRADENYAYEKPSGVKRVVSLGDSFTVCYEVDAADCFSRVLEHELRKRGEQVQVLNAGVSGFSNAEELLYLERELYKYDPDVVLVSFFVNDLVDNERTGLFALEDGQLVQKKEDYVPAGRVGNFLNTNPVFNWLAGYSNAFVVLKERVTRLVKRHMVAQNRANVARARDGAQAAKRTAGSEGRSAYQQQLAAAIFDRMYAFTHKRGVPLVIHSIPSGGQPPDRMTDAFPLSYFDVDREGLYYLSAADVLRPLEGKRQLRYLRSHFHWTPVAHRTMGKYLARLIVKRVLMDSSAAVPAVEAEATASPR